MTEAPTQYEIEAAVRCLKAAGSWVVTLAAGAEIVGLPPPLSLVADPRPHVLVAVPVEHPVSAEDSAMIPGCS